MIDINNESVKVILEELHNSIASKMKNAGRSKDVLIENLIITYLSTNIEAEPRVCAEYLNAEYGYNLIGENIIQHLRERKLTNISERKKLFETANKIALLFEKVINGDKKTFEKFSKEKEEYSKMHRSAKRVLLMTIFQKYPEIDQYDDSEILYYMMEGYCKFILDTLTENIGYVYDFAGKYKNAKKEKLTEEQADQKIKKLEINVAQLSSALERTNSMLAELQEDFDIQIEENKQKDLVNFFSRLNSDRYGYMLDELIILKKGMDNLRKQNYELPLEINGLMILVKKLIQFIKDSHIAPIKKMNEIIRVKANDIEFFDYEASPFSDSQEEKTVKVVSPGWIYKDKQLQISRPKVKEEQ